MIHPLAASKKKRNSMSPRASHLHAELDERGFDDGFVRLTGRAALALSGAGRPLIVELGDGYTHSQVYTPPDEDCVALEPMTAPADALTSGRGLRLGEPGAVFRASFRIELSAL